jgi:hypothetical protein
MAHLWGKDYSRTELLRRVGDIRQIASVTPFQLVDGSERGCRGAVLKDASALQVTVLTDRGMALTDVLWKGVPIPFVTAQGAVHPSFADHRGRGWLRSWPGGFDTPCGMTQVGSPCVDGANDLGLHGRLSSSPAMGVSWGGDWRGDDYVLWVQGTVPETIVFGEYLTLARRVSVELGKPLIRIEDRIENRGFSPAPLMFLHHINLGFPLIDAGSRLELPRHHTEPRDDDAKHGLVQCCDFSAPMEGSREQVFYHDLEPNEQGVVEVWVRNPDFDGSRGLGLCLRYRKDHYPVLVEWKMMSEGCYVVGLEPANCHAEGRNRERQLGSLQVIAPQAERRFSLEIQLE